MEFRKGKLAISKAGHDKGCWYVILEAKGEQILLVNGENRTLDRPKTKKTKHLQLVNTVPKMLQTKLDAEKEWTNEEIKRALKLAKKD